MSTVDFEEAGHKLLTIKPQPGQEMELCVMLLECCSQERTYLSIMDSLACIGLTQEHTTSSSRIFIKILFQKLSEHLGLRKLNERLSDPTMQDSFDGIFPKDNPKNSQFAINFITSIGLGGLTDSLRECLKNMPRLIMQQQPAIPSDKVRADSASEETSSGSEVSASDVISSTDS
ncbi:unnamed protein product [Calypogeia fissa]